MLDDHPSTTLLVEVKYDLFYGTILPPFSPEVGPGLDHNKFWLIRSQTVYMTPGNNSTSLDSNPSPSPCQHPLGTSKETSFSCKHVLLNSINEMNTVIKEPFCEGHRVNPSDSKEFLSICKFLVLVPSVPLLSGPSLVTHSLKYSTSGKHGIGVRYNDYKYYI